MSRLGGFNFVVQIRRDKLLDLIQENVTVQGNTLSPPFRLFLAGPPSGLPPRRLNAVDLLVKSVDLALGTGTNFCNLKLGLEGGVIRLPDEPEATFAGGEVNVRMQLLDGSLLFARPLEATLNAPVSPVLAGIPNFAARANSEVSKLINAERNQDFNLFPQPEAVNLLFLLFGHNRNLDADTFCAHVGVGDAGALTPGLDGKSSVSLAIAADAIKTSLPSVDQLSRSPVTVTGVSYIFRDGSIDVEGTFDAEDDCWWIDGGRFSQRFFLKVASGSVVFTPDSPELHLGYRLHLEWYCVLVATVVTIVQIAVFPLAPSLEATMANSIVKQINQNGHQPAKNVPSQAILNLAGVTWNDVVVSPEGLVFLGDLTGGGVVAQAQHPAVHLRTKNDPQNLHPVVQGSVTVQAPTCASQSFDYVESIQDDRYTLTVDSEWLFEPIEYAWTVNGQALTPPSGEVILGMGNVSVLQYTGTVKTALPPPDGTRILGHAIELRYGLGTHSRGADRTLVLNARNEDANYDIRVEVRATDALGRVFGDAVNLTMRGDIAEFGTDYDEYMSRCLKAATDLVNKKGRQKGKVKPGEPQEQWQDLLDAVMQQAREGNAEAVAMIPGLMKAFGVEVVNKALAGKTLAGRVKV